jgi:cell division protein YceG involved in septum cleavage
VSNLNPKTIIIVLLVVLVVLLGVVGYLLMTENTALNNTSINNTTGNVSTEVQRTTQVSQTSSESNSKVNITAAKAKSIASDYLATTQSGENVAAGTPSLKGGIYYVPMVITNNEGQHSKGTVVGYVKVDAETGQVFGIQEINIY